MANIVNVTDQRAEIVDIPEVWIVVIIQNFIKYKPEESLTKQKTENISLLRWLR